MIGVNGTGKSTLLKIIAGLETPQLTFSYLCIPLFHKLFNKLWRTYQNHMEKSRYLMDYHVVLQKDNVSELLV
ncbi:ATP-binding cassette domain-containing protein [Bacillus sp. HC-TM]